ncbi:MAG: hypothetical protein V7785_15725 [Bermanella sp.]
MASFFYSAALLLFLGLPVSKVLSFDPMAPPGANKSINEISTSKKPSSPRAIKDSYILRQIVIRNNSRSAVINGYVVNEGSLIKNAKVQKIDENSVVIKVSGKHRVLTLESALPNIRR